VRGEISQEKRLTERWEVAQRFDSKKDEFPEEGQEIDILRGGRLAVFIKVEKATSTESGDISFLSERQALAEELGNF